MSYRHQTAARSSRKSEEEIAANQFVSVAVVKQRLRLASVSPKLLDVYGDDGMTLDQLMAFMRRRQSVHQGASTAAHALRAGDGGGSGSSVSVSEGE